MLRNFEPRLLASSLLREYHGVNCLVNARVTDGGFVGDFVVKDEN